MNYQTPNNTEWKLSSKGNYWRKKNGLMLSAGGTDKKGFWVRVDDDFLKEKFESLEEAKQAAEESV
jgi:hypothetical protein